MSNIQNLKLDKDIELEYQKFLRQMQEILDSVRYGIDNGDKEVFYVDEDIYLGKGEYLNILFEALHTIGLETELDYPYKYGRGMWIRGW